MALADVEKSAAFRLLVAACNHIEAGAEEGETDDGMAVMVPLELWHEFSDALERARTMTPAEMPQATLLEQARLVEAQNPSGLYAIRYRDNFDGEGDVVYMIAKRHENGSWTDEYSGKTLLEYQGDEILQAWLLNDAMSVRIDLEGQ